MDHKPGTPETAAATTDIRSAPASPTVGQVVVRACWSATCQSLTALQVASERPPVARLLVGKTPAETLRLVPMLYSLCGNAQAAAAGVALRAAEHGIDVVSTGEAVRRELIQEHLWRLLLDWPEHMSHRDFRPAAEQPLRALFALWHRRLKAPMALDADGRAELMALVDHTLGERVDDWAQTLAPGEVAAGGPSPAAPDFLPALSAALLRDLFVGAAADFARLPRWQGRPAETGALARQWQGDASLAGRLRARWRDLRHTVASAAEPAPPVLGLAAGEGTGIAGVDTARGLLVHRVRLHAGRIADYQVIAPTEWNFHPQQRWQERLARMAAETPEIAENTLRRWMLALDPCVPIQLTIDKES